MPPIHLLQCNSWQPQPKISVPFRGPSPGNIRKDSTSISMKGQATPVATDSVGLHKMIISRVQNSSNGPKVEVFLNISEQDYVYVLNAIGSDSKVIRKPSYNPHLQELTVTLPSPIHEAVLVPLCTALGIIIDSLTIPDEFDVSLPIHMAHMVDAPATLDLPCWKFFYGILMDYNGLTIQPNYNRS
ncbi:hypothetical protein BDR04DRAFT_1115708 [Suillus decipiens]|nr:hypothetical protein BDR04DRAFT_1115708 [Suillus decipiens]